MEVDLNSAADGRLRCVGVAVTVYSASTMAKLEAVLGLLFEKAVGLAGGVVPGGALLGSVAVAAGKPVASGVVQTLRARLSEAARADVSQVERAVERAYWVAALQAGGVGVEPDHFEDLSLGAEPAELAEAIADVDADGVGMRGASAGRSISLRGFRDPLRFVGMLHG